MDPYVVDPGWHGYIIWYFFLGGIAAGSYAMAAMAAIFGDESDRRATRAADYLGLPLIAVCGVLLIVDLGRPERFYHMLIASETGRPILKWWSPMSAGSWALSVFGAFAAWSFAGVLVEDGWIGPSGLRERVIRIRRGPSGRVVAAIGSASAFFLGSYTGVLLAVTNQPVWSDSTWLGALFLASAASTGLAAMLILARWRLRVVEPPALARIERLDLWAAGLEALMLAGFALSLGGWSRPAFLAWPGLLIPLVVVPFGIVAPFILARVHRPWAGWASPALVLASGFLLRLAVVEMPGVFRLGA